MLPTDQPSTHLVRAARPSRVGFKSPMLADFLHYFQGHKNRHDSLEKCTKKEQGGEKDSERRSGERERDAEGMSGRNNSDTAQNADDVDPENGRLIFVVQSG